MKPASLSLRGHIWMKTLGNVENTLAYLAQEAVRKCVWVAVGIPVDVLVWSPLVNELG